MESITLLGEALSAQRRPPRRETARESGNDEEEGAGFWMETAPG